jgi:hypothetical protein
LSRSGPNLVQEIDPPVFIDRSVYIPTPGVPPTCPSRFHCTRIHIIVDGLLGISENRAMKLLISTFFTLLLISLAGASYAQIPQIERDALVALYNSTDGANWTDNTGWLGEAGTECSWFGVRCYALI